MNSQPERLVISNGNHYNFISLDEIIRIEAEGSYSVFYLASNEKIVSSKNLGYFTGVLARYGFYLSHKSHLVNTTCISSYKKEGTIVMNDASEVPVSRRRKNHFFSTVIHAIDSRYFASDLAASLV